MSFAPRQVIEGNVVRDHQLHAASFIEGVGDYYSGQQELMRAISDSTAPSSLLKGLAHRILEDVSETVNDIAQSAEDIAGIRVGRIADRGSDIAISDRLDLPETAAAPSADRFLVSNLNVGPTRAAFEKIAEDAGREIDGKSSWGYALGVGGFWGSNTVGKVIFAMRSAVEVPVGFAHMGVVAAEKAVGWNRMPISRRATLPILNLTSRFASSVSVPSQYLSQLSARFQRGHLERVEIEDAAKRGVSQLRFLEKARQYMSDRGQLRWQMIESAYEILVKSDGMERDKIDEMFCLDAGYLKRFGGYILDTDDRQKAHDRAKFLEKLLFTDDADRLISEALSVDTSDKKLRTQIKLLRDAQSHEKGKRFYISGDRRRCQRRGEFSHMHADAEVVLPSRGVSHCSGGSDKIHGVIRELGDDLGRSDFMSPQAA